MTKLQGTRNQQVRDPLYCADLVMTGSPQLVLAESLARSFLMLQNLGSHAMNVEFGSARAHATISGGVVTAITLDNAGFNFTDPPVVELMGGGPSPAGYGGGVNKSYLGLNQPNGNSPSHTAKARAVLTAGAVSSFLLDDGGSGYQIAPYVFIRNSDLDPYGAAIPSSTSGISLPANMTTPIAFNGTACTTDPISVLGTSGDVLLCRWCD